MTFGRPEFLWLFLLLAVPLVLYLLPLPRRLIQSSALFLWQRFLASQRFGAVSDRFRRALGFALLAAILISLILAAADLSVGSASSDAPRVVVLIDNSASMSAVVEGKSNLSRAKDQAAPFVHSLNSGAAIAIAEAAGKLNVIEAMPQGTASQGPKLQLAHKIDEIAPFEGAVDLKRMLDEAYSLWGADEKTELYAFTDRPLPDSKWGSRAHAWLAPQAGDNAGIVDLQCQRRGKQIRLTYKVANFGAQARSLNGTVLVNAAVQGQLEAATVNAAATLSRDVTLDETGSAAIEIRLPHEDALACDDSAFAYVPSLDDMKVNVVWPEAKKRNEYVWAVLSALQAEGVAGPVSEQAAGAPPVTVYVNQVPATWPEGNAIVLYPIKSAASQPASGAASGPASGAIQVSGLHADTVTVSRQAEHALMADVDLRGLSVKGAVQAAVPEWATVLAWGGDVPLIWSGETGHHKVLFVGVPVLPSGSRLPLVSSFPVLMRNALQWMISQPQVGRVGQVAGYRTAGNHPVAIDSKVPVREMPPLSFVAVSTLSAAESDLRRLAADSMTFSHRRSLAALLVILAMALLPAEWALFHKRVTE